MDKIRLVLGGAFCVSEDVEADLFPDNMMDVDIPDKVWRLWGPAEWKKCASEPSLFEIELTKLNS